MTARFAAAAALALAAFTSAPALADGAEFFGDCNDDAVRTEPVVSLSDLGRWTGTFYLYAVVDEAEVSCELRVNGVTQDVLGPVRVVGAGAAADVLTYTTNSLSDDVDLCMVVRFFDGTPPLDYCFETVSICDTFCVARRELAPYAAIAEAEACARTGGDVHAGGVWVLDCPPYWRG